MSVKDLQRVIKFCVQADKTPVDTIDIENLISTRQFFGKACSGQFINFIGYERLRHAPYWSDLAPLEIAFFSQLINNN